MANIWVCIKISNWPNIYYLHVAANFRARKLLQNLWQKYEPVSRLLINLISITYMLQPFLGLENCFKFYGKCKIFLMSVYMIFKYSKHQISPFIHNLKKTAYPSKQDRLVLATIQYMFPCSPLQPPHCALPSQTLKALDI